MSEPSPSQANPYAPPNAAVQDVDTRAGTQVHASRLRRLCAAILDGFFFSLAVYVPLGIGLAQSSAPLPQEPSDLWILNAGTVSALVGLAVWGAVTYWLVQANGQTIAKRLLGIKVVRRDGSRASVARIFWLRNVVNAVPTMLPYVGWIYFFVDSLLIFGERRQCLHDRIADTIVVRA